MPVYVSFGSVFRKEQIKLIGSLRPFMKNGLSKVADPTPRLELLTLVF